jgi:hypothetical protein
MQTRLRAENESARGLSRNVGVFFLVFVIVEESQDLEKVSLQLNMKIVPSTYLVLEPENAWHRCLPPIEYRALQGDIFRKAGPNLAADHVHKPDRLTGSCSWPCDIHSLRPNLALLEIVKE